jgi:hypothetical protein
MLISTTFDSSTAESREVAAKSQKCLKNGAASRNSTASGRESRVGQVEIFHSFLDEVTMFFIKGLARVH